MDWREVGKDILVLLLILLIFTVFSTVFFFLDGGQIWGINDNPDTRPNYVGQTINGVTIKPGDPNLEPVDDGTKIIPIELWQLPPRDILLSLFVQWTAYIPPNFGNFIKVLYAAFGLSFFVLYRRKNETKARDPDSRQEIIYQTICKTPGISQQMIVEKTGFSRGSVRHHVNILLRNFEIITAEIQGHPRYMENKGDMNSQNQMLVISLTEKKNTPLLLELLKEGEAKISELAEATGYHQNTTRWRIQKLEGRGILCKREINGVAYYSLEKTAADSLMKFMDDKNIIHKKIRDVFTP